MAVKEVIMYRVTCDHCGCGAEEDSDFYSWVDAGQAIDEAIAADWTANDQGQWCPRCSVHSIGPCNECERPALYREATHSLLCEECWTAEKEEIALFETIND